MPLVLAAVFLVLFGDANPVIDYWLSLTRPLRPARHHPGDAASFSGSSCWCGVGVPAAAAAAFPAPQGRACRHRRSRPADDRAQSRRQNLEDVLFGKAAILRALVVFNLMFAVQTVLDAAYLWGGVGTCPTA